MSQQVQSIRIAAILSLATLVAATHVSAQAYDPACQRQNNTNTTEGAIIGGVAGALLGSAVAGRHERTEGAVVGGVGGAVVGGAVASSGNHPCPPGYVYRAPPPPPGYGPPPSAFWQGAPEGIHERIDFLQMRIDRGAQNGFLGRGDVRRFNKELNAIRRQEAKMRHWDGGELTPPDRDRLFAELDDLSHRLNWEAHRDQWDGPR